MWNLLATLNSSLYSYSSSHLLLCGWTKMLVYSVLRNHRSSAFRWSRDEVFRGPDSWCSSRSSGCSSVSGVCSGHWNCYCSLQEQQVSLSHPLYLTSSSLLPSLVLYLVGSLPLLLLFSTFLPSPPSFLSFLSFPLFLWIPYTLSPSFFLPLLTSLYIPHVCSLQAYQGLQSSTKCAGAPGTGSNDALSSPAGPR